MLLLRLFVIKEPSATAGPDSALVSTPLPVIPLTAVNISSIDLAIFVVSLLTVWPSDCARYLVSVSIILAPVGALCFIALTFVLSPFVKFILQRILPGAIWFRVALRPVET